MSNIVIKATDISKQYRLGLVGSGTLRDDAARFWAKIRGKEDPTLKIGQTNDRTQKSNSDYVWALKDINFEVQQGEILGIIGKNGAGKSTLLKILSKITAPTTGSIKIKGRIASLLEVGTGFHGELTGRENIYLNGAVLGMSRREVTRKLDEIVDFAGVEKYMDTPVKRYSSGMTVRLGFAVAAHLDPDILVVDEVLAVGDAEFQKKAIGKMQDVSNQEGRTILFVSHNMNSVKSLCNRGLLLEHGSISFDGNIDKAVARYLGGDTTKLNYKKLDDTWALEGFTLKSVAVKNRKKTIDEPVAQDDDIEVIFDYEFYEANNERFDITLHFKGEDGTYLFVVSTGSAFENGLKLGKEKLKMYIPSDFFNEGEFTIDVFLVKGKRVAVKYEKDVIKLLVIPRKRDIGVYSGKEVGFIQPQFEWSY
ncbi:ABC transporter ATP-binding protein (plasmid) [Bernardetia sp. Wsw4-3y2]|uniref:ABC transporter ATP-binding protein n=1 Tax=Bernardetia sp. Wsw4-3y2 TaxID=3127471 RepID=UPI0030CED7AB